MNIQRKKRLTFIIVLFYFASFLTYAYIRYVVFIGLDFASNGPFIINKAFAGTSVVSIFTAYLISSLSKTENKFARNNLIYSRFFGLSGFYFMSLHIFFALRILSPELFPHFFESSGFLALRGKATILLGIIGFLLFLFPAITSIENLKRKIKPRNWKIFQRIGYFAYFIIMIHVSFVGFSNWFTPEKWAGGMPPITLICVSFISTAIIYRISVFIKYKK